MSELTQETAIPSLPSAKPPKSLALLFIGISGLSLVAGLGLGGSATAYYLGQGQKRVVQSDRLARLDRDAELAQREAQLQRGYSAPVWVSDQTYAPGTQYQIEGVREIEVPVLLGPQLDTAVCIGTMGPDGFIQNTESSLCLGY